MTQRFLSLLKNRPGSVLAFVAVFLPATLGTMALAIDLGMLFQARVEAQRAADFAALAGAKGYIDQPALSNAAMEDTARLYATRNSIRGVSIDSAEVYVEVRPSRFEVYVHVHRDNIPTWFARFLGFVTGDVSADATAQAVARGGVDCLRPLALPDLWADGDQDINPANRIWDYAERWQYNPNGTTEFYNAWGTGGSVTETGFGSTYRNGYAGPVTNDYGLQIIVKQPQGNPQGLPTEPGWFYPLALPGGTGGNWYRGSFTTCRPGTYFPGDTISNEPGAMVGPTFQGVFDAIQTDPTSQWDAVSNQITNSAYSDYRDNPRVLLLALFDPAQLAGISGRNSVVPNNFAHFYLEGFRRQDGTICSTSQNCADSGNYKAPIVGRFMYFAQGVGEGPVSGPLVRQLKLIE